MCGKIIKQVLLLHSSFPNQNKLLITKISKPHNYVKGNFEVALEIEFQRKTEYGYVAKNLKVW